MQPFALRGHPHLLIIACLAFLLDINTPPLHAQSRVDSIEAAVKALNENYQRELTRLYHQMLEASNDPAVPREERYRAKMLFYLFPIEENLGRLLDSIDFKRFSINDSFYEEYPYRTSFGKLIYQNGEEHPALMNKILARLDEPQNEERLYLYGLCIESFLHWNVIKSWDNKEKAACLRIMANSIIGVFQRKENLLKIADMLEQR